MIFESSFGCACHQRNVYKKSKKSISPFGDGLNEPLLLQLFFRVSRDLTCTGNDGESPNPTQPNPTHTQEMTFSGNAHLR